MNQSDGSSERRPSYRLSAKLARLPVVGPSLQRLSGNPAELRRFGKWMIVGAIGALIDFTLYNAGKLVFEKVGLGAGWSWPVPAHQVQLVVANAISFTAAVLSNFLWNRRWTFPESRNRPFGSQLTQFTIVSVLGFAINTALVLLTDRHVFQPLVSTRLSYNLAKAFATVVVLFWNYGANRVWTYRGIR